MFILCFKLVSIHNIKKNSIENYFFCQKKTTTLKRPEGRKREKYEKSGLQRHRKAIIDYQLVSAGTYYKISVSLLYLQYPLIEKIKKAGTDCSIRAR